MVNKFIDYLIWAIIIAVVLGVLWLIIEPIIRWTQYSEVRLCVRLFLLMFAVSTFATLRLYNSIVQNTRFSIKLREALNKFAGVVPGLERAMKNLNSSLGNVKASTDSLKKELSDNTDKVEKLTEKINRLSNIKN